MKGYAPIGSSSSRTSKKEIGFKYIRMHGLLHDDMGVYSETAQGNPIYNWQYIDKLTMPS